MSIMPRARAVAKLAAPIRDDDTTDHAEPFAPSAADLDAHAAWLAAADAPGQAVAEPTPPEVLDHDAGTAPWWLTLPAAPELDEVRYGLPTTDLDLDGLFPASAAWIAEGRGAAGRASRRLRDDDQDHYRHHFRG
jgi:hypothetical protein